MVIDSSQWTVVDREMTPVVNAYFSLKNALIEWDSTLANQQAALLKAAGDSLVADSTLPEALRSQVGSIAAEADGFIGDQDLEQKRRAFSMMSQQLLPLLKEINYKAQPVYQQICPMAFNDTETAYWLSGDREINNPYLGKKHPKDASGMLHCGELGDSLTRVP
jgi:hypothetical protein